MTSWRNASTVGLAVVLLAGQAQAAAHRKRPPARPDARDARIKALEGQVGELVEEVRALRQDQAADRARVQAVAAAPRAPGAGATVVGEGPAVVTPGLPQPSPVAQAPTPGLAGGLASITGGKPSIASADGRFSANLHGVMQFDAADYFQDSARSPTVDLRRGASAADTAHARDLNDGTTFRRARIGIDGKVYGDFEYNILFDFGGSGAEDGGHIQELWLQYSGLKPFHLKIGAFRPNEGLEDAISTNGMPILERPDTTDITASLSGGDFREGAQLWASSDRWYASGAITSRLVGVVNSQATGTAQSFDQSLGFVGRAAIVPFRGDDWMTHIGVHGSYAYQIADAGGPDVAAGTARYPVTFQERPELRVDGTRLVSTGGIDAEHAWTRGAEVAAQKRNVMIEAEYETFGIDRRNSILSDPDFSGYYVEGSWILTGERRRFNTTTFSFDGPLVDHPFSLHQGRWGAFELALRYSDLDLNYHAGQAGLAIPADGVRGGEQKIYTAGLNWYLNNVIRFMIDYQHVDIDRLSPSAATFSTPVGAQIGQTYDTLAIRSQMAF